jgi:putative acetyltransferase
VGVAGCLVMTRDEIRAPTTAVDLAQVKKLLNAYARSLDFDLCFQDFDAEMAAFPGRYAGQEGGALRLALRDGVPVGAVGLRDLGDGICEMKRLYLDPCTRGDGLGCALAGAIIEAAGTLGYHAMRLDTVVGHHDAAITLYRRLGFREIRPYYDNPIPGALYMELCLGQHLG